jgi:hypothetical protein
MLSETDGPAGFRGTQVRGTQDSLKTSTRESEKLRLRQGVKLQLLAVRCHS